MAQYKIFDNIIEKEKASSYVVSTIALLNELDVEASVLTGSKVDIGTEGKSINKEAFLYNNAYNLSLAHKENADIICVEDSSYISLNIAKVMLLEDKELKEKIEGKLQKDGLELSLETKVLHVNEILRDVVGFDKLLTMIKKPFSDFNVAVYKGNKSFDSDITESIITLLGATIITFETESESDGYEILGASKDIADKLAGTIMLDAFDNAADFVITNDARSFSMFDTRQKSLEKSVGRDIELNVYSLSQIVLMALGCEDKSKLGFESHKIKPTII